MAKQYDKAISIYKDIIGTSTTNIDAMAALAQTQYVAGYIYQSVQTLEAIKDAHPELTQQVDAAIKQVQGQK
jgi:hypothetical protein